MNALQWLKAPFDEERRATLPVQIVSRWLLILVALAQLNVDPQATPGLRLVLNGLVLGVAAWNATLMLRLRTARPMSSLLPIAASVFDALAITAAVALYDQFENVSFVFYFPAFVAFGLVFPGWWSVCYTALAIAAYVLAVVTHPSFDPAHWDQYKELALRIAPMVVATTVSNMVVHIERDRRARAVAEALAAHLERQRVSQEIHDGIAQEVYMLAVSLEANAKLIAERDHDPELNNRMAALVGLAKRALLETRGLLFNLEPALAGDQGLVSLLRAQAAEFSAVTRIPVSVTAGQTEARMSAAATVEVYRIVQEALANIYRHSGASRGEIGIAAGSDHTVTLHISDDGQGFDPAGLTGRGHGLRGMRERVERLGGTFDLATRPGNGAMLTIIVPSGGG